MKKINLSNEGAYYFSHDCDAKDDPKCVLLIEQLGLEGYGIFWVLVEILRSQPNLKYPLSLVPALARKYNTTSEKMKTVIQSYRLFIIENDEFFFSESLNRRMQMYFDRKKVLSEAGKKGNQKRWNVATRSLPDQEAIAIKEKVIKENIHFDISNQEEVNLLQTGPPDDGVSRNRDGLKRKLEEIGGDPSQKNAMVELSNYGEIGNPIWSIFQEVANSRGKIHTPVAFILSKLKKQ